MFRATENFRNLFELIETDIFDPGPPKFKIQKMKIQSAFECTDVNSRTPGVSRSRRGPILS